MKTLLFTGASGFLGQNVLPLLKKQYEVDTLSTSTEATYQVNLISDKVRLNRSYDIILHAAGKAHSVPKTEKERRLFFDINCEGTKKICRALEKNGVPKAFVFISTVAVYGCNFGDYISENHPLNGVTPYAKSKIDAELFLQEWCARNNVILTILRPSLIAGKNPPGNLGSMIKGIEKGKYLSVAGGNSRKSVLMASDIAKVVPLCEEKGGIFNICDDSYPSFHELEELISKQLGKKNLPLNIPFWFANFLAYAGDLIGKNAPINSLKLEKIVKSLTFSNKKIKQELGFEPTDVLSNFIIK